MKTFKDYLVEAEDNNEYVFCIKIAGCVEEKMSNLIEVALDEWGIKSISKPKITPIQKNPKDFPNIPLTEVSIIHVTLSYPTTPTEISSKLAVLCNLDNAKVKVYTGAEMELDEVPEETEKYEVQLTADYPKSDKNLPYGDKFIKSFLKDQKRKKPYKIAGGKTLPSDTTNDLPQGTTSVLGNKKKG